MKKILLQMFVFGLSSLFELLEVSEDCYGIGYLSKVIATELANLPAARTRRKVNQAGNTDLYLRSITMSTRQEFYFVLT